MGTVFWPPISADKCNYGSWNRPHPSTHTHCGNFPFRARVNTGLFQQWRPLENFLAVVRIEPFQQGRAVLSVGIVPAARQSPRKTTTCAGCSDPSTPDATGATLHGLEPTMTNELTRRQLLSVGAAASVAALPTPGRLAAAAAPAEMPRRKLYAILSLGRLGFQARFPAALELTVKHGFEGLDPHPTYFPSLSDDVLKR